MFNAEKSHLPRQVGFVLRYKLGRSGLATGCGGGIDREPFYTPAPHRNQWETRNIT